MKIKATQHLYRLVPAEITLTGVRLRKCSTPVSPEHRLRAPINERSCIKPTRRTHMHELRSFFSRASASHHTQRQKITYRLDHPTPSVGTLSPRRSTETHPSSIRGGTTGPTIYWSHNRIGPRILIQLSWTSPLRMGGCPTQTGNARVHCMCICTCTSPKCTLLQPCEESCRKRKEKTSSEKGGRALVPQQRARGRTDESNRVCA